MFNGNFAEIDAFVNHDVGSLLAEKNVDVGDGTIVAYFKIIECEKRIYCFGTSWTKYAKDIPHHTLISTIGKSTHAYSTRESMNSICIDILFNRYLGNKATELSYFSSENELKKTFKNLLGEDSKAEDAEDTHTTYCMIIVKPSGRHRVIYEESMTTPPIDIPAITKQYSSETPTFIRRLATSQNPYINYLLDGYIVDEVVSSTDVAPIPTLMLSKKPILASYMGPVEIDGFDVMDVDDIEDDVDVLGFILDTRKFSVMVNTLPHLIISDINHYFLWDGETLGHYTVEDIKAMFAPIVSAVSDPRKRRLQSR